MRSLLVALIVLFSALTPLNAHAFAQAKEKPPVSANDEHWGDYSARSAGGAVTEVTATKGAKIAKIKVGANIPRMVKGLARGGFGMLITDFIIQKLGEGVDYLLDPANNTIQPISQTGTWRVTGGPAIVWQKKRFVNSIEEAIEVSQANGQIYESHKLSSDGKRLEVKTHPKNAPNNPYTSYFIKVEQPKIPLAEVAQWAVQEASKGNSAAQQLAKQAALEAAKVHEYDTALDAAAVDKLIDEVENADTQDKPKVEPKAQDKIKEAEKEKDEKDGETSKLPDFCDWAKVVCDFIRDEPPKEEKPKTIPKSTLKDLGIDDNRFDDRVNFTGVCPTGNFSFSFNGRTYSKAIPYEHFCSLLELLRPWLLAFTYLSTAFFVVSNL